MDNDEHDGDAAVPNPGALMVEEHPDTGDADKPSMSPTRLPSHIPAGARVVVRVRDGISTSDNRMKYRDYIGHVHYWDGTELDLMRDAAANGSRPQQRVWLRAETIVRIKPIPERPARNIA
ncbi:MAG: DUF6725 domain-containing protein [Bifidobacterium crudilactis]